VNSLNVENGRARPFYLTHLLGKFPTSQPAASRCPPRLRQAVLAPLLCLIPLVPSVAASTGNLLPISFVRVDVHAHPAGMGSLCDEVFITNVGHENVVHGIGAFELFNCISRPWRDDPVIRNFQPIPINLLASGRQISTLKKCIAYLPNTSEHFSDIGHNEHKIRPTTLIKGDGFGTGARNQKWLDDCDLRLESNPLEEFRGTRDWKYLRTG
jgi:hypothetical protein